MTIEKLTMLKHFLDKVEELYLDIDSIFEKELHENPVLSPVIVLDIVKEKIGKLEKEILSLMEDG